ncbi:unnamed protein product [Cylindrotheca closterium]|uniref:Uncharacterized protein n=1 Tax=Cylindrotheca closterium TaxID=2856 RepID=A0AAD2FFR9_9STRA|nr:unnamed protein product [Cylindrotheca closterium]
MPSATNTAAMNLIMLLGLLCIQCTVSLLSSAADCFETRVYQARRLEEEYYDRYDAPRRESEGDYWDEPKENDGRGGVYKVYFDGEVDAAETHLDWETCSDGDTEALVLLPPPSVERPTSIIHFVGGTFFGSAPKLWYRTLLEGVARNTQSAVVVTPIPVTLLKSPLNHVNLGKKLRRSFCMAWRDVLEDEYGDIDDIPVCGLGHSLGARLMVVLTTLTRNQPVDVPPFRSFALISFTNYGASAGVPGIYALSRESKIQERKAEVSESRKRQRSARRSRDTRWMDDEFDDEIDEEWDELVDELGGIMQNSASKVKTALTPRSDDLEFFPTPDNLWKALDDKRYDIPETLVVQFDDDEIDQSAKLAQTLHNTNSTNVKYCRLRGTHLSPVTISESESGGWLGFTSTASKSIERIIRGQSKKKAEEATMRDLISSLARYINDVGAK